MHRHSSEVSDLQPWETQGKSSAGRRGAGTVTRPWGTGRTELWVPRREHRGGDRGGTCDGTGGFGAINKVFSFSGPWARGC